jgi:hypothetical protein
MCFCNRFAQFKTKFHVRSLFYCTAVQVLRQRWETYIHCTLSNHWQGERSEIKYVRQTYRGGRAVVQAVSRWLPTVAARVRIHAVCGVCGGQSGTGADFLRVLRLPLPIIPPISPSS